MEKRESIVVERDGRKVYESYMGLKGLDFLNVKWDALTVHGISPAMEESLKDLTRKDYSCFRLKVSHFCDRGEVLCEAPTLWELLKLIHAVGFPGERYIWGVDYNGVYQDCVGELLNGKVTIDFCFEDFSGDIYNAWSCYVSHLDCMKGDFTPRFPEETEAYAKELALAFKEGRVFCDPEFHIPGVNGDFYLAD